MLAATTISVSRMCLKMDILVICNFTSASGGRRFSDSRFWNEHSDHPILPGRDEKFAIAGLADMQIGPRDARPHRSIDEFPQRHTHRLPARVSHEELDFFNGRDGLRDSVIRFLHLGKIGCKETSALDIAKNELALKRSDSAVICKTVRYCAPFIVVVHRDGIREAVLLAPVHHVRR